MDYPTLEQVNAADYCQLARWHRFLPPPGSYADNSPESFEIFKSQNQILACIGLRLKAMGGMTPGISKEIGLDA